MPFVYHLRSASALVAQALIGMVTLRRWPATAIVSGRTAPHIPGHSPVVLSYSRSMISSIIATNETLCYLLEQFARSRGRDEDTRYCATARGMVNSTLYGKSRRRSFAQSKC